MVFVVRPKVTRSLVTTDGVRLDADVYYPEVAGEFPVLLMRQPYGRAIASTVVYAHPIWYAAQGYIVVIQDVRGRGTSEGKFDLFATERQDGRETVLWAANLPGSNGRVGMYGFSYQGMTQLYAAIGKPEPLQTISPAMIGYDLYQDWAYENGAFCLQANLGWAIQLSAETARLQGDEAAFQALFAASRNLPLGDRIPAQPKILQDLDPDSFYHDWINHPQPDAYWENLSPKAEFAAVDLPILHIGGWFDPFLRGTLNLYKDMAARSQYPQHLWVGPWAHLPWGRKLGAIDYGPTAATTLDEVQIRWFDQFLKDRDTGLLDNWPVNLFEMGTNQWRSLPHWPTTPAAPVYLSSTNLAGMNEQSGILQTTLPDLCPPDIWVHDPWRPVPALGGHAVAPSGSCDRSALDCRSDILTYTSPPLETPLVIAGDVTLEIWCQADAPSFDLCATLSDVHPNGSVYNFTQGYLHIPPGAIPQLLQLPLQATCQHIAPGHALRLSLSAACFPAYPVNPGTGTPPTQSRLLEAQVITLKVACGGANPSRVQWQQLNVL